MNRHTVRGRLISYLLWIVGGLVVVAIWLRWNEPRMIYYPQQRLDASPVDLGLAFQDVRLTTSDGVAIHGWWLPAPQASAGPVMLFLHGNAGNISHRLDKLKLFHDLGVATLIIDYRGYGRSTGTPNEPGTYADAEAAYQWLIHDRPTAATLPSSRPVYLYGESLGAAIAVELATRVPVDGVVIEEAFTSVAAIGQRMFPFVPVRMLVRNKYDTLSKINQLNAPLLVFHSQQDEIIPFRHGEQLFAGADMPKTFVALQGGHNDAFMVSAAIYREALATFFTPPDP